MFPLPLVIEPHASASARVLRVGAHLAALAALLLAQLPLAAHLAGAALLGASLWQGSRPRDAVRLRGKADGQLEIWRDTAWAPVQVRRDSVALPGLIVLRWREGRRRHSLALPGDALSRDDHRRLRVWLRWKARVASPPRDVAQASRLPRPSDQTHEAGETPALQVPSHDSGAPQDVVSTPGRITR